MDQILTNLPALGASGAVVVVVYFFIQYLKERGEAQDKRDENFAGVLKENTMALAQNATAYRECVKIMERVGERLDSR